MLANLFTINPEKAFLPTDLKDFDLMPFSVRKFWAFRVMNCELILIKLCCQVAIFDHNMFITKLWIIITTIVVCNTVKSTICFICHEFERDKYVLVDFSPHFHLPNTICNFQ